MDPVIQKVAAHGQEALSLVKEDNIVGIFLQGSQNYGLSYEKSDVDTKLIITPTLQQIALAEKPISTTHIRENEEHIDLKDIRLYIETFRKQNLNFLEILFTPYYILNPTFEEEWKRLIQKREEIAHMNPYRAVKSMKGIAMEKYHAMEHPYPSKLKLIEEKGYDGKQVSHLIRVDDYLERYIKGEPYLDCLHPSPEKVDEIMSYKRQEIPLDVARTRAEEVLAHATSIADTFCESKTEEEDTSMRELLQDVSYNIIRKSIVEELKDDLFRP